MEKGKQCEKCPLKDVRFVPAEIYGDPPLDILFIGEAPGAEEEREGRPFVGRSGQLLRDKFYNLVLKNHPNLKFGITNVVKCRPPQNETPDKTIVNLCRPYIDSEILDLKPRIIVLLGRVALKYFLGFDSVTKYVNTVVEKNMPYGLVQVVVTYHPASVLRDIGKMRDFELTFSRIIPKVLEKGSERVEFHYKVADTVEEFEKLARRIIEHGEYVAFDVETPSIQVPINPTESPIYTISLAVKYKNGVEEVWAIPLIKDDALYLPLKEIMENPEIKKIAHNGKYDIAFLKVHGIDIRGFYFDTLIAHHLYDENLPHNLGYLATEFTPFTEYKSEFWESGFEKMQKLTEDYKKGEISPESEAFLRELLEYNAKDAYVTLLSFYKLDKLLNDYKKAVMRSILIPLSMTLMDVELSGWKIDINTLQELEVEYSTKISETYRRMVEHPWVKKFVSKAGVQVNLNSTKQLKQILFDIGGLPIIKKSKKTQEPSTSTDVLLQLADRSEFVRDLLEYRKLNKIYTAFIKSMPEHILSDGKIHPRFNITGTVTGRLSSDSPNIQQIPKGSTIRKMFVSNFPDGYILEADYSQLELRVAASVSGDEKLMKAFELGEDLHRKTASAIFNKPPEEVTDEERRIAKGINFGVIYGITPVGLVENLVPLGINITKSEAEQYIKAFFSTYKGVYNWVVLVRNIALKNRVVHSIFGVERHLRDTTEEDLRQATNFVIQSSAAYFTFIALNEIRKKIRALGLNSRILATIHDSIVIDAPASEIEIMKQIIREAMVDKVSMVVDAILKTIDFPEIPGKRLCVLDVDIKQGKSWYIEEEEEQVEELFKDENIESVQEKQEA